MLSINTLRRITVVSLLIGCLSPGIAVTQEPPDTDRLDRLERRVQELEQQLEAAGAGRKSAKASAERFSFGGYGEIHANLSDGPGDDQIDIHRFVLYVGYQFEDWIRLHTETEIEHAFISDDDGEVSIEQMHFDFLISEGWNVRAGRMLIPLGITNRKHEPPSFNGVERPAFDKFIIPTTWAGDGVGIFGRLADDVKYKLYVVGGLDGSAFTATDGIRDGRIKERPSLNEVAVTSRVDYYPFVRSGGAHGQTLRVGLSGYGGGLDNGNNGSNPDLNAEIIIGCADFEYTIHSVDFRGAIAYEKIHGARRIGNGTASDILGYYAEAAVHCLPASWKKEHLVKADLVLFARYDHVDTQHDIPSGTTKDKAGTRDEFTLGLTWFFNRTLVLKGDVQIRNDRNHGDLPTLVNFGLGWEF